MHLNLIESGMDAGKLKERKLPQNSDPFSDSDPKIGGVSSVET